MKTRITTLLATNLWLTLAALAAFGQGEIKVTNQYNRAHVQSKTRASNQLDSYGMWLNVPKVGSVQLETHIAPDGISGSANCGGIYSSAITQVGFKVTATTVFDLLLSDSTAHGSNATAYLKRDGEVVAWAPFSGAYTFEKGHAYEIYANASEFSNYSFSVAPPVP